MSSEDVIRKESEEMFDDDEKKLNYEELSVKL